MPVNESLEFGMDGAHVVLTIGGQDYPLVAEPLSIQISGSGGEPTLKFRFRYKESATTPAIVIGTPSEVVEDLQTMLTVNGFPPALPKSFRQQWDSITNTLTNLPIFARLVETFENTSVRISEIALELTPIEDKKYYRGKFRFGLTFTPAAASRPRLFNIEVKEFGATLYVDVTAATEKVIRLVA